MDLNFVAGTSAWLGKHLVTYVTLVKWRMTRMSSFFVPCQDPLANEDLITIQALETWLSRVDFLHMAVAFILPGEILTTNWTFIWDSLWAGSGRYLDYPWTRF